MLGAAAFDQLWYVQERGFERAEIARLSGWIGMTAGVLGNLFGGWGGDWWQRRFGSSRLIFLFWVMLLLSPLNLAYRLVPPDSFFFFAGIFFGFFGLGAFYGPTFSTAGITAQHAFLIGNPGPVKLSFSNAASKTTKLQLDHPLSARVDPYPESS